MSLEQEVKRIAEEFEVPSDILAKCVQYFQLEMENGLSHHGSELSQLPTYVTKLPSGTEKVRSTVRWECALCLTWSYGTGYLPCN